MIWMVLIIAAFAAGVYVGRMPIASLILDDTRRVESTQSPDRATPATTGGTVKAASLTPGQQKLLSALGINVSEFVITPAMIACAEAKVGAARIMEIQSGATPSFSEGVSLLACYK